MEEEDECLICHEVLDLSKNFLLTECAHRFHYSCFKLWDKDTCPYCRQLTLPIRAKKLPELPNFHTRRRTILDYTMIDYISMSPFDAIRLGIVYTAALCIAHIIDYASQIKK